MEDLMLSIYEIEKIKMEAMQRLGIGWFLYRFDGTVVSMDHSAFLIFELNNHFSSPEETIGKNLSKLVDYISPVAHLRTQVREVGSVRGLEWEFKTLGGSYRTTIQDAYILSPPKYPEEMIQVILQDRTQHKKLESELTHLKETEEQHRVMIESFGTVCHHFNQPLTVLYGYLNLLNQDLADHSNPTLSKYFKKCMEATEEMTQLIYKLKSIKQYKSVPYNKALSIVDLGEKS